jgi:hypothetical protein
LPKSVVIRATHVVTALGTDQLAVVPGKAMAAGRADLAMVVDRRLGSDGLRITLWDNGARILGIRRGKIRIKGAGTLGQHG